VDQSIGKRIIDHFYLLALLPENTLTLEAASNLALKCYQSLNEQLLTNYPKYFSQLGIVMNEDVVDGSPTKYPSCIGSESSGRLVADIHQRHSLQCTQVTQGTSVAKNLESNETCCSTGISERMLKNKGYWTSP